MLGGEGLGSELSLTRSLPCAQEHGARALSNLTFRNAEFSQAAREAGALPEWLDGLTTARATEPSDPQREVDALTREVDAVALS